jgi:ferritin-like metal-binding protein YciE
MEQGGVLTLENHAAAAQGYPEVQARLHAHAESTRRHAELVKECLERLGGHPSALKETIGAVLGKVQGVANLPAQDTVVKNALGDLAAESFEIASYTSLIAAAESVGDHETATTCRQILRDEEEMAAWLTAQIPAITRQFLAEQTGEEGQGVQAQALDKTKQTIRGLGKQGKEFASKAKQKGQGVQAQVVDRAKKLAEELEEQGEELASKAKQRSQDTLIMSGAMLVGAGVGMLLVQALRSGADKKRAHDHSGDSISSQGIYNDLHAGYVEAGDSRGSEGEGSKNEPVSSLDLQSELLDLGEPFMQNTEFTEGDRSGGGVSKDGQIAGSALSSDEAFVDTEPAGGDVRNLDELPGLDVDLIAAEFLTDGAQGVDELSSLDANSVGDVELLTDDLQDMDNLASPDADPADTALLADDAQGDVESVAALAYTEVWLIPGPYSGRGPIGYDSAGDPTGQEVYSRLTQHGQIDASDIEIVIDNGEVLLDGTVDSEETKRLAQEAVETITGVRSVQNLLQVKENRGS